MMTKQLDPSSIKALAFDLDGTILRPDRTLSPRTLNALRSCAEQGRHIIIVTGRSLDSGEQYRRQIGVKGPHVYYNGAEVAEEGNIIFSRFIDPQLLLVSVKLARKMNLYFQIFFPPNTVDIKAGSDPNSIERSGEVLMADKICIEAENYQKASGVRVVAGDLEEYLARVPHAIKGMFIASEESLKIVRPILEEQCGNAVYLARTCPIYLEVLTAGISKGTGLSFALEHLHLSAEQAIAFGDEENDLPMFDVAAFSAAPANAKESVRKAAVFQIPSNIDDGAAVFLEETFKIRKF
jgi:Cof subfamily protein (haloacid dehalogenase superfamily)